MIKRMKNHRTVIKDIPDINTVKSLNVERLGVIPTFFFLVVLFGVRDYSGPYCNLEQGLLILYHFLTGFSMSDMGRFIPKSSFHSLSRDFYEKGRALWREIHPSFGMSPSIWMVMVLVSRGGIGMVEHGLPSASIQNVGVDPKRWLGGFLKSNPNAMGMHRYQFVRIHLHASTQGILPHLERQLPTPTKLGSPLIT
ncbi:hypothetical protein VTP01DRAFT_10219 [Rhizomucor pusillus]|uniref:uncharacterized protein n=1 Tax=Rhizomucor pusillus TaxID=4840 RepID=UPI0037436046